MLVVYIDSDPFDLLRFAIDSFVDACVVRSGLKIGFGAYLRGRFILRNIQPVHVPSISIAGIVIPKPRPNASSTVLGTSDTCGVGAVEIIGVRGLKTETVGVLDIVAVKKTVTGLSVAVKLVILKKDEV